MRQARIYRKERKFFAIALYAVMMLSFAGCDNIIGNDIIVDWAPVSLYLRIVDSNGVDLLDPENPDNMIEGTTLTFKGVTYNASTQWYDTGHPYQMASTKAIYAPLYGLFLVNGKLLNSQSMASDFSLYFGEIDGARDMDEDLTVTLPNGTTATIHYHCSNHNERRLTCNRSWTFNGKKHNGSTFVIEVTA